MKQLPIPTQTPKLEVINGHIFTSSLDLADNFGKKHYNVIKAIKNLDVPDSFRNVNFNATFRKTKMPNGAIRQDTYYNMTRDGFVILVMGFTGKEAMQWKIRYIEAFNAMEAALATGKPNLLLGAPSGKADRKPLSNLVNSLVSVAPVSYRDVWHMVKAHLKIDKHAADFTVGEVHEAIAFVQEQINIHTARPVETKQAHDIITEQALKGTRRLSCASALRSLRPITKLTLWSGNLRLPFTLRKKKFRTKSRRKLIPCWP